MKPHSLEKDVGFLCFRTFGIIYSKGDTSHVITKKSFVDILYGGSDFISVLE
jgi:hypothetical protein